MAKFTWHLILVFSVLGANQVASACNNAVMARIVPPGTQPYLAKLLHDNAPQIMQIGETRARRLLFGESFESTEMLGAVYELSELFPTELFGGRTRSDHMRGLTNVIRRLDTLDTDEWKGEEHKQEVYDDLDLYSELWTSYQDPEERQFEFLKRVIRRAEILYFYGLRGQPYVREKMHQMRGKSPQEHFIFFHLSADHRANAETAAYLRSEEVADRPRILIDIFENEREESEAYTDIMDRAAAVGNAEVLMGPGFFPVRFHPLQRDLTFELVGFDQITFLEFMGALGERSSLMRRGRLTILVKAGPAYTAAQFKEDKEIAIESLDKRSIHQSPSASLRYIE